MCIQAHDRAGLERLLGYCARPPVAMDQLGKEGRDLVCRFFGVLSTGHRCGEAVDAQTCEGVAVDPDRATDWDEEAQPAADQTKR